MTTDWPNHLTTKERAHLAKIDAQIAELKRERNRLANMAKLRRHRAEQKKQVQTKVQTG